VTMIPAGENSLTRQPELSRSLTSRDICYVVGGMDEGVRSLLIHYLIYVNGYFIHYVPVGSQLGHRAPFGVS
jgi:hypothetical protein